MKRIIKNEEIIGELVEVVRCNDYFKIVNNNCIVTPLPPIRDRHYLEWK